MTVKTDKGKESICLKTSSSSENIFKACLSTQVMQAGVMPIRVTAGTEARIPASHAGDPSSTSAS